MSSLSRLPPADARVYNDYLLPSLSLLPNDPEESVRVTYAQALAQLAAAAHEHLLAMQYGVGSTDGKQQQQQDVTRSASANDQQTAAAATEAADVAAAVAAAATTGTRTAAAGSQQQQQQQPLVRYDAEMEAVRSAIEKVVLELVAGLRSSPDIKRGLLAHAGQLGTFFGRRATTDQLLPPLYTCLNDHVEWRLRSSFYGAIAALGPHTGHLDIFMLPYLEQVGPESTQVGVHACLLCVLLSMIKEWHMSCCWQIGWLSLRRSLTTACRLLWYQQALLCDTIQPTKQCPTDAVDHMVAHAGAA